MNLNNKLINKLAQLLAKPLVILFFFIKRITINSYYLNNIKKNNGSFIYSPLAFLAKIVYFFHRNFNICYLNHVLKYYKNNSLKHYGFKGKAFSEIKKLSESEKKSIFTDEKLKKNFSTFSRLQSHYEKNFELINFKNGDSFLDAACGYGREINFLCNKFNDSKVDAFDIDNVIDTTKLIFSDKANIFEGDLTDLMFLDKLIKSKRYNWVIVSHALSSIMGKNIDSTISLRKNIIKKLCELSINGLIILENFPDNDYSLKIDNSNRAVFNYNLSDSLNNLNEGKLLLSNIDKSIAYIFIKN